MAAAFPLDIVTPERTIVSEDAVSLRVPAASGSLGILHGHAPLVAELGVGECHVRFVTGAEETLVIAGGFVEVSRERVTVLADTAEFISEIDVNRAEEALAEARALVASAAGSGADRVAANEAIRLAQARLRVVRGETSAR